MLPFSSFSLRKATWRALPSDFSKMQYISHYREWTKNVIGTYEDILAEVGVLDGVHASQFSYDH